MPEKQSISLGLGRVMPVIVVLKKFRIKQSHSSPYFVMTLNFHIQSNLITSFVLANLIPSTILVPLRSRAVTAFIDGVISTINYIRKIELKR